MLLMLQLVRTSILFVSIEKGTKKHRLGSGAGEKWDIWSWMVMLQKKVINNIRNRNVIAEFTIATNKRETN